MGYNLPTVSDFKNQFVRDFPYAVLGFGAVGTPTVAAGILTAVANTAVGQGYLPNAQVTVTDPTGSGATVTASIANGSVVSYSVTTGGTGYTAPVVTVYGGDDSNQKKVTDVDIQGAIQDAAFNINECLFEDQASFTRAFNYLAAHNLVETILASVEGLASQYSWLTAAKSVGGINQSFQIPEMIAQDPFLASLSTTRYGLSYLRIVLPYLVGHTMALPRITNPV